jgi:hypothetical protein
MMMNNNEKREKPIDPILIEKISLLGAIPERNPSKAAQGRERFLEELEGVPAAKTPVSGGWLADLFNIGSPNGISVQFFNRKFAFSTVFALIVVAIMLFGGASATAYASQSSLPGDALYPIKMGLEQTQISLTNDAYAQAKLHLEFAQRRLEEIKQLLTQGRSSNVEFASDEFEQFIQQAMEATNTVMASDPERGAELSNLVSKALLDYAIALKAVLLEAPDPVKPVVEKALLFSQDGAGDEIEIFGVVESISDVDIWIDGEIYLITDLTEFEDSIVVGDSVKLHAILTPEGDMIVREIELASSEDELPEFGDDNGNENDSVPGENENSNDNDDGNSNDSDDNENESEDNANDGDNENNENDNESNENDNDDDSNENLNDNESEDDEVETKSEDNENNSGSNDNEDKSEENDNENTNESEEEEDEEKEEEDNENDD